MFSSLKLPANFVNKIIATIIAAILFLLVSIGFASEDDFNANAAASAIALQQWYGTNGLWETTGWWNAANCVEALENIIVADNGRSYLPVLANTFRLNCRSNYVNDYYDDEGWWALAWIRAYDLSGRIEYLNMARTIFRNMTTGWSDHCGGGLIWRKKHGYKNAIPNELFLLVAIRLHQRTPDDGGAGSYLDWALKEWDWFKQSGMINQDNLVNDGLTRSCQNNGRTTWTYNQGVIVGGLVELYKTTEDTNYLDQATQIADAAMTSLINANGVLAEPQEDQGLGGPDVPQFKGIFIRNLACLYDETRNPAYHDFLLKNARSVWADDRDKANHLGLKWSGPFDFADAARQSSAMMAVGALAEPMTQTLPFAKGAGSVTFRHETGASAGTLAWNCNAANAPVPGLMLSGDCAMLLAGKQVVHFRMAVDAITNSTSGLVQLEVKNDETRVVLADRQIHWNEFTAIGQPQDFPLAFTNSVAGSPLTFQVYWNHVDHAPSLTLTDVTIGGSHNWTAANLAHDIGRLDGLNGWEADPVRDPISGYLIRGPGTKELPVGKYSVGFELKVDNFNWDKSNVATLSVVEAETGEIVASRTVTRDEFPDTLYHTFTLNFEAKTNGGYNFRTFWHCTPHAPRLTQRSVVVQTETAG
jgi:predicted alpha-1,6-mannanase (GH76 family)